MKPPNCSLEFLRRISRRRRSAQRGVKSTSEYVEQRATLLTLEQLDQLRADLPLLNARLAAIAMPQFPHLQQQFKLLADFFEDTAEGVFQAGSDASRKESAFALRYAAKETVIIPDFVPEIGYADDSLIVRTVLSRRQIFSATTAIQAGHLATQWAGQLAAQAHLPPRSRRGKRASPQRGGTATDS
jgi:uncharacterized membrane protein YkvA (DUF1232 family)